MMWDTGIEKAPVSVKKCHLSWVGLNPDHKVYMLNLTEGEELVGNFFLLPDLKFALNYV